MIQKQEVQFLAQLVNSLGELEFRLEESYKNKDVVTFNKVKKLILQIQEKISESIK